MRAIDFFKNQINIKFRKFKKSMVGRMLRPDGYGFGFQNILEAKLELV